MLIYHGTHYKNLNDILHYGLSPRKDKTKRKIRKSNWKAPSHADMVYMSVAYPFWYALQKQGDFFDKGVVFEIDTAKLNESNFYPDEDFVHEALNKNLKYNGKEPVTLSYIRENLEFYKYLWTDSLKYYGGFCHKGIVPLSAITQYCIIDFSKRKSLYFAIDPAISLLHYNLCGEKYEKMVQWFFGYRELLPFAEKDYIENQILQHNYNEISDDDKKLYNFAKKRTDGWIKESKDRTGIEIVHL